MAKYRKKPVVIDAWPMISLHHAAGKDWESLPKAITDAYDDGNILFLNHPSRIDIVTLEGTMTADVGDMLIQGVEGELYPCKPNIFEATYEPVE